MNWAFKLVGLEISILNTINQELRKKWQVLHVLFHVLYVILFLVCIYVGAMKLETGSEEGNVLEYMWHESGRGLGQKGMNRATREWCREAEEGETTGAKYVLKSFKETNCFHTRFEVGESTKVLKNNQSLVGPRINIHKSITCLHSSNR